MIRPNAIDDMRKLFLAAATINLLLPVNADAAGKLEVAQAWIRAAPPGAMMLAGYATLTNRGDAPIVITGASSELFASASLHETVQDGGVEHMRSLGRIELTPGAELLLAPGGKHLMLMRPQQALAAGSSVKIHFDTNEPSGADAEFLVRNDAPDIN